MGQLKPSRRAIGWIAVGVAYLIFVAAFKLLTLTPGPLHVEARQKAEAEPSQQSSLRDQRVAYLCKVRLACSKFGAARQDCAAAGNFDQCMQIKLGDDVGGTGQCGNDGSVLQPPADTPTFAQCGLSAAQSYFK